MLIIAIAVFVALAQASTADAELAPFEIQGFTANVADADGIQHTQAGGHPDHATTSFSFPTYVVDGSDKPVEDPKDVVVDLPVGFVGNPQAAERCSLAQLASGFIGTCPSASRVGTMLLGINGSVQSLGVYNLAPERGFPAEFGVHVGQNAIVMYASVRSGSDYGLTVTVPGITRIGVTSIGLTFFGTPAAQNLSGGPLVPFLSNPTDCTAAQVTDIRANTWEHPAAWHTASAESPKVTGCDKLASAPTIAVTADSTQADTPARYTVDLSVPQTDDPDTLATPPLRDATVTLPPGVILNAGVADGLQGCSDAQFGEHTGQPASCPEAAKIGSVEVTTPLLDHHLNGSIYLRQPDPGAQRTTGLYAILLDIEDAQTGVIVKLRGNVVPDAMTGQLTATFTDNPQLPFSDFKLTFKGGGRAALANPQACGAAKTASTLSSWGGPTASPTSSFDTSWDGLGGACPVGLPFSPVMSAGTVSAQAGASSPFTFSIGRADRQDIVDGLTATLPAGLLASVKDVPLCGDADANAGSCPAATNVGTATVGAGSGPNPFHITGTVSLTGPYKGGPYGLAIAVHAVAGPLDLGWVVVRQSIQVNLDDAHLTVISDPIPTIQQGAPFRLRTINVTIDRPGFMRNPTNCDPKTISSTIHSVGGITAPASQPYQVTGCDQLPFSPKLAMKLSGTSETKVGGHPGVEALVTQQPGEAALKSAAVTLPLSLALDPDNANGLCEFGDGLKDQCPENSVIGSATAVSPLLKQPLTGKVYFVKGLRTSDKGQLIKTLPTLLVELRGEIDVDLRATTSVPDGQHLVTTFPMVPDAAISAFHLNLTGGRHGIVEVTDGHDLCVGPQDPFFTGVGQNGKRVDGTAPLKPECGLAVTRTFTSASVHALVSGIGAGVVTVSGPGVKTVHRTIKAATNATVVAPLTAKGRALRKARQDVRLRVSFVRKGTKKATIAYSVKPTLKTPAKKKATNKK